MIKHNLDIKVLNDLFTEGGNDLQILIDNALQEKYNTLWWKKYFTPADMPTPVSADDRALFAQVSMTTAPDVMLMPRAAWTPPKPSSKEGFNYYEGSLANYGRSYSFTAQEVAFFQKMLERANGSAFVAEKYMKKADQLIKGAHATVSNLSAQLLSKGQYIFAASSGSGFSTNGKANIPAARFKKAGAKVWSDVASGIISKMQTEEKALRDATGYAGPLSWKMDRTTFNYVMANTEVKTMMKEYIASRVGLAAVTGLPAVVGTVESYNEWVSILQMPNLSIIEIVEESQQTEYANAVKTTVNGWLSKNAVLSPLGLQGEIKWADVEEYKYMAGINKQFAYIEGGIFAMMNWKNDANRAPEWIAEILAFVAPTLSVFDTMTIVDTLTADS